LEEIRLRHSSAERRPGIADVKNGVPGRVRSGLCVTELGNFCSTEHPLREVISSHFSESFWYVVADFGYCSCARLQNVSRDYLKAGVPKTFHQTLGFSLAIYSENDRSYLY